MLVALVVLALIWLDRSFLSNRSHSKPKSQQQQATSDFEKYHGRTFNVIKIIDGDTIDINVPDGEFEHTRIRFWGVDTPETKNPKTGTMFFGPEATEFVTELVLGSRVCIYLDTGNRTRGKYGRLLAYVQLPDASFLNEVLLSEGFAYADLRFRHSLYQTYQQLEAVARSQKKGLWKEVTREQLPEWLQQRKPQ